jgi:hypothetical protein
VAPGQLSFEEWIDDNLRTHRYVNEGSLFERPWSPPDAPPGSALVYDEQTAIYLGLIWRLTSGLMVYGVPRFVRESGMYAAGEPYALVRWEYDAEISRDDELGAIRGFVPAHSVVRSSPPPGPWSQAHENEAGLFELPAFAVLEAVVRGLLPDGQAELNLYALARQKSTDRLVAFLQGPDEPDLRECLQGRELFIHLAMNVDAPRRDVIIVHARSDVRNRLQRLTAEYIKAMRAYEADVQTLATHDEWDARVEKMLNIDKDEPSRWAGWPLA